MPEIKLVPYSSESHLEFLKDWLSNEKLMHGWDMPPFLPDSVEEWASSLERLILMIVDVSRDNVVGFMNFYKWNKELGVASRGTLIDPNYQNQGYGKAAIQASNDYAFNQMNLKRIELYVSGSNKVSKHITEKLGYTFEYYSPTKDRYYYFMERP
jgi:RimJ/RimL family protein N-acetyltransferase